MVIVLRDLFKITYFIKLHGFIVYVGNLGAAAIANYYYYYLAITELEGKTSAFCFISRIRI